MVLRMSIEGLRLKLLTLKRKLPANFRKRKLNKNKFTIISNNCWGGEVYECYNLIKQSPTIRLYFMSKDYIKFIKDIHHYINQPLNFINPKDSKYYDIVKNQKRYGTYPVARLDDIEIFFMHYVSKEQAKAKWNRRVKRIDWDHILYKFNDQNGCSMNEIEEFIALPVKNKICFTVHKEYLKAPYIKLIKAPKSHQEIRASYEPFGKSKYVNVNDLINSL